MIGQRDLLANINKVIDKYPKFSIIVGPKGSGKKTVAKHICGKLGLSIVSFGTSIEEVRKIIDLSYEQDKPICYLCADADSMSLGAKNALLKITEEPPQNAYFILTLEALSNTLETIQSRSTVWHLDTYTENDLINYREYRRYNGNFDSMMLDACTTTGDVDELFQYDVPTFHTFAETVAFKIIIPTSGNIFKMPKSLKLSVNSDGYDPILLFRTVRNLYLKKAKEEHLAKYLLASSVTSECLRELSLSTVSKLGTVDKWIMDVRSVLR